ncbi:MAG: hypothetical protein ABII07_03740 [Patescibacteria group bacterium]|nr:hypothetical protein [Patescibacteria group bacterium]
MEDLFDKKIPFREIDQAIAQEDLRGMSVQVCTVRQKNMEDIALGNVFWLLQAAKARNQGAEVVVTDFYDKQGSDNQGIRDFMDLIGMKDVELERAEDVPRDMDAWRRFCDFVNENPDESMEIAGTVKGVRDCVEGVLKSDQVCPQGDEFKRFIEEFSVWVRNINSGMLQWFHHEVEMTRFSKAACADSDKQFWQFELPINNEYRGKYDKDGLISHFRLKDLPEKLALGEKLEGFDPETAREYAAFYRRILDDLLNVLGDYCQRFGICGEGYCLQALMKIDPGLAVIHAFNSDDNALCCETECLMDGKSVDRIAEVVTVVLKNDSSSESLVRLTPIIRGVNNELVEDNAQKELVEFRDFLVNYIEKGGGAIDDVCRFWIGFVESAITWSLSFLIDNPVINRIVASDDVSESMWAQISNFYKSILFDMNKDHPLGLFDAPLFQRILSEVEPVFIMEFVDQWCTRRGLQCYMEKDVKVGSLQFIENLLNYCEQNSCTPHDNWVNAVRDQLNQFRNKKQGYTCDVLEEEQEEISEESKVSEEKPDEWLDLYDEYADEYDD